MATTSLPAKIKGVYEASVGPNGTVLRGRLISSKEAIELRKKGFDVVVCGPDPKANRAKAQTIEMSANNRIIHHGAHANSGQAALNHYQPDPRPPEGHTFYESYSRSAQ